MPLSRWTGIFISLEDEPGVVQVIVWKSLRERQRPEVLRSRLLLVQGVWQREGEVMSLIAGKLEDLSDCSASCPRPLEISTDRHRRGRST